MEYVVTLEIKTPMWKKFLRFFRIIKQRETFKLYIYGNWFGVGDIIENGTAPLLILKSIENDIRN